SRLEIKPEVLCGSEVAGQSESGIGTDTARTVHDLVNPSCRNAELSSEPVLGDTEWLEKFRQENLARVDRCQFTRGHSPQSSMVVDDLDVMRIALAPDEADAPLVVDTNAVLALTISRQPL